MFFSPKLFTYNDTNGGLYTSSMRCANKGKQFGLFRTPKPNLSNSRSSEPGISLEADRRRSQYPHFVEKTDILLLCSLGLLVKKRL